MKTLILISILMLVGCGEMADSQKAKDDAEQLAKDLKKKAKEDKTKNPPPENPPPGEDRPDDDHKDPGHKHGPDCGHDH